MPEAAQQQKPAAFRDPGVLALQGMGEDSTGLVNGLMGERHHAVGVVHDIEPVAEDLAHDAQVRLGQVDGDGLKGCRESA